MRMGLIGFVTAAALCAGISLGQTPSNVTVTLKKIVETREMSVSQADDPFAGWHRGIELTLHIDGPGAAGARKYGMLKITRAVDDAGTDLTKQGEGPGSNISERFEDVRNDEQQQFGMMRNRTNAPKPTGFDIELKLPTPSARGAKTIKQLSGTVQVVTGGEKKIVEVKQIKQNFGKAIEDPSLKALGVTFTLGDPTKRPAGAMGMMMGDADSTVPAVISGKIDAIADVKIVDGSGDDVSSGSSWSDDGGKRSVFYSIDKPLSDDMKLQIEVWPGQKTVTVPIEMKDVKLP